MVDPACSDRVGRRAAVGLHPVTHVGVAAYSRWRTDDAAWEPMSALLRWPNVSSMSSEQVRRRRDGRRSRLGDPRTRWQHRWEARTAARWQAEVEAGRVEGPWPGMTRHEQENWPAEAWFSRRTSRPWKLAILLTAVIAAGTLFVADHTSGYEQLDALGWVLLLVAPLALGLRRRFPIPVAVLVALAISAYYLLGYPAGPVFLALLGALHALIGRTQPSFAWGFAGVGFGAFALAENTIGRGPGVPVGGFVASVAWAALILVGAEAGRVARERAAEAYKRRAEAEQRRKEAELRRVSDERLRIAREVHDLLGHHLSLISVQSGVALHLMDSGPAKDTAAEREQLHASLAAIKRASKDALVELRATVNTLRGVDEDAPRQPAPTLERLDDLLDGAGKAGVEVRTEVIGERTPLPPRVDLAAFRIVQEALTNVRRHAGSIPATVTLTYGKRAFIVQIDDDGPVQAASADEEPGGGNGIPGMRERAVSVGGTLTAQPRPDGGFRVRAELPLDGDR
jgi:signal transduction histidine kinase